MSDPEQVSRFFWRDVFPGALLLRTIRIAAQPLCVFLVLMAMLLSSSAWVAAEAIFSPTNPVERTVASPLEWFRTRPVDSFELHQLQLLAPDVVQDTMAIRNIAVGEFAYVASGWFACLLTWAIFGGTVLRIAVVRLAVDEQLSWRPALQFMSLRWRSLLFAILLPLLCTALLAVPLWLAHWLLKTNAGAVVVGFGWGVVLLLVFVQLILLLGVALGWPLMWAAIAAEGTDCFDAVSRAYSYVFQRPAHYLMYVALMLTMGLFWWAFVDWTSETVCQLAVAQTIGNLSLERQSSLAVEGSDSTTVLRISLVARSIWTGVVQILPRSFANSFFLVGFAAVYLLLRWHVDQTETDDVYFDREDRRRVLGIPGAQLETTENAADEAPAQE
ncbi:MAG: hypothetical protein KDA87_00925 [Planctomycetales bacterium]|nr:hypothetical protein [Planctomycetales bacterium]